MQNAQTAGVADRTLLNLFHIDRLDSNQAQLPEGDGYFDYVTGITIFPEKGYMMFPKVQPFGDYLASELTNASDAGFLLMSCTNTPNRS